ncbi:hypothetical protein CsSME_00012893 [Camellia sinensis var. sinensis]
MLQMIRPELLFTVLFLGLEDFGKDAMMEDWVKKFEKLAGSQWEGQQMQVEEKEESLDCGSVLCGAWGERNE